MNIDYPIRIAQVMGKMENGGVEAVTMNYYRHLDRSKIQFDFIVDSDSSCPQEDEILSLGGRVYKVAPYQSIRRNMADMEIIFHQNQYLIVQSNLTTMSVFSLRTAKKCGVPIRICHGHNTASKGETKKNVLKYMLRPFAKMDANCLFACSSYAGQWLFGENAMKRVRVVHNAVDIEKFSFQQSERDEIRRELGIENNFVIGHIGRFVFQKNHEFLIDFFAKVYKMRPNAVLLLIGDGPLEDSIKQKVHTLHLDESVRFLGIRHDVEKYYNAFDVFVLPSHYEGLPVVGVEAQTSGLPCVFSDAMTIDTKILDSTRMLRLSLSTEDWAKCILAQDPPTDRKAAADVVRKRGFDISVEAAKLQEFYLRLYRKNKL